MNLDDTKRTLKENNMKYYSEEIVKNLPQREEYCSSIIKYINEYPVHTFKDSKKFEDLIGLTNIDEERSVKLVNKSFVAKDSNVNIYRIVLLCLGKIPLYGIYFEPIDRTDKTALSYCIHGGDGVPEFPANIYHNSGNYGHMARRLTDRGIACFCPQLLLYRTDLFGGDYNRLDLAKTMLEKGTSLTALELKLLQCSLDYFINEENYKEVGCCGLSYGGYYTLRLAAIDKRIKTAFVASDLEDNFVRPNKDYLSDTLLNTFQQGDIGGLIAPRPLVTNMGDEDEIFPLKGFYNQCEIIKKYYKALNKEENFYYYEFKGKHEFDLSDKGLNFYINHLQKNRIFN